MKSNPPTRLDFLSHKELGVPLRNEDQPELWAGLSCQATEQQARRTAKLPGFGAYIARIEIEDDSTIVWRRTGPKQGHHTIWGNPDDVLACVIDVIPV